MVCWPQRLPPSLPSDLCQQALRARQKRITCPQPGIRPETQNSRAEDTPMIRHRPAACLVLALMVLTGLAACTPAPGNGAAMGLAGSMQDTPPGAPDGTCWGKIVSPALIETVTEQVLVDPARLTPQGDVAHAAIYRTETRQRIVTERRVTWFETPCPADMTPEVIATLQRALAVRAFYTGPVTGQIDAATSEAVGRYQASTGLQSRTLSLAAARALGVLAVPLDALGGN
jgi:peptidoglycan hydrolase-like protein with peptidoglycan-binding domain